MNVNALVQIVNDTQQLGFRDGSWQLMAERSDPDRSARLSLRSNVDAGRRIIAYEDCGQTGHDPACLAKCGDRPSGLAPDNSRHRLAIDNLPHAPSGGT